MPRALGTSDSSTATSADRNTTEGPISSSTEIYVYAPSLTWSLERLLAGRRKELYRFGEAQSTALDMVDRCFFRGPRGNSFFVCLIPLARS